MKDAFQNFNDTYLTIGGLIIFFGFFIGVLWWTSLKANKENYRLIEQIPLKDEE